MTCTQLTTDDRRLTIVFIQRYPPFGEVRTDVGTPITQTDFGYTGQRNYADFGLMDYLARFYSPYLNRWIQPDSIVPDTYNPQSWYRYGYVQNNPINYNDPTGHWPNGLFDVFTKVALKLTKIVVGILNTPAIKEPDPPLATNRDVTSWTTDRINENATSFAAAEISDGFDGGVLDKIDSLRTWIGMTRVNATWDYKPDLKVSGVADVNGNIILGGIETNFQAVANYHYGALASEVGIPRWMAEAGAGAFQIIGNRKHPEFWGGISTWFDAPFDNYWIIAGYDLAEERGDDFGVLNTDDITEQIIDYVNNTGAPPRPAWGGSLC